MKHFLIFIAIFISGTLCAQKKDSTLYYRNQYLANEAKYILNSGDNVKAIQLLLESLPAELNPKNSPIHQESIDLLKHIYYNRDNGSTKIELDGDTFDYKFSPNGKFIAFTSVNKETIDVYLYDISTAELTKLPINPSRNKKVFAISPNSKKLVVAEGGMITEWNIETKKIVSVLKYFTEVFKIEYAPDNEMVYVLGGGNSFVLVSFDDKPSKRIDFGMEGISDFSLSANGKVMLVKGNSQKQLWDMETLSPIGCDLSNINYIEISPCGTRGIVAGKEHKAFTVIDLMSGEELFQITVPVIVEPVYSNDGRYIVGTCSEYYHHGKHMIFDATNGNEVKTCCSYTTYATCAATNYDASMLAKRLPKSLLLFKGVDNEYLIRQNKNILDMDISNDDSMIATCSHDTTAMIWDLNTGKLKAGPLKHPVRSVRRIKFSPHGQSVATLCDNDSIVRMWNTNTGELSEQIIKDKKRINDMEFSSCGKYIYTASDNGYIYKWHVATGAVADSMKIWNSNISKFVFNWEKNVAATVSKENTIAVWNMEKWEKLSGGKDSNMKHKKYVRNVNFSKDGSMLVSTSADSTMVVWSVATGEIVFEPEKFKGQTYDAKFLCNDSILAVSCWDFNVYFYNTQNWEELPIKLNMDRRPDHIAATSDNEYLFVNSVYQPLAKYRKMSGSDVYSYYRSNPLYMKPLSHKDSIEFHLNAIDSLGYAGARDLYEAAFNTRSAQDLFKKRKYDQAYALVIKALDHEPAKELFFDIYYKSKGIVFSNKEAFRSGLSNCGNYIVTAKRDGTVNMLNSTDLKEVYSIRSKKGVQNLRISEDGKQFALYYPQVVELYNLEDGSGPIVEILTERRIIDILFTSGGKIITVEAKIEEKMQRGMCICIRDNKGNIQTEIPFYNMYVSISLSSNGKYMLYSDAMKYIYLWELGDENRLVSTYGVKGTPFNFSAMSKDGKYIANTYGQCNINNGNVSSDIVEIWNTKELKYAMEPLKMENDLASMEFSPCSNFICTVEMEKEKNGNQKISYYKVSNPKPLFEHYNKSGTNSYNKIKFSKDGKYIAIYGWDIVLLDTNGNEVYHRINNTSYVNNLEFINDNKQLLMTTGNGTFIINLIKDSDLQQIIQKEAVNK